MLTRLLFRLLRDPRDRLLQDQWSFPCTKKLEPRVKTIEVLVGTVIGILTLYGLQHGYLIGFGGDGLATVW